ncbi:exodeoxyribonuclease VII large subunit [Variovorax sp. J22P168]|uniref:exodeoxyribonuclease VII large subunit n=1 Tax=Variovorax jilinensis TaxID=3053513 RepID=UPI0025788B8E|nr:exodeoxyribonuclease VII large subunit [Variovorax sp. J22P168]MDM0013185.1 exodeoxyribonuclease VII large subunit [Variovorax sp. J22P168]
MEREQPPSPGPRVWAVGALCRAVADALDARFNPVTVQGEISGFSRASSGHCYFSLKDASGQLRCAMFRRAAGLLDFSPRDGDQVEVRGRLAVYEPRGDLQLVVESLRRAGQGALFEQFMQRKARLEAEGLFDPARKRPLAVMPRAIGLVTSLGAAALHDVVTALRRRVPHIPLVLAPAAVQGAAAPAELVAALRSLYALDAAEAPIDVILLVRGGGSIEDLWAFNDETLARTIVQSPVPLVSGVGHETDFTIADFCADLRAPTPTAAAELVAAPRDLWLGALELLEERLRDAVLSRVDGLSQRLDQASGRLGRPSNLVARQRLGLARQAQRLHYAVLSRTGRFAQAQQALQARAPMGLRTSLARQKERLERAALRLQLLDPALVLQRGYAWLTDADGHAVTRAADLAPGDEVSARLADGSVALKVQQQAPPAGTSRQRPTPGT